MMITFRPVNQTDISAQNNVDPLRIAFVSDLMVKRSQEPEIWLIRSIVSEGHD